MAKKEELQKSLEQFNAQGSGRCHGHIDGLLKRNLGEPTTSEQLYEINLRLKQLVALKVLENIHEGRGLFYDDELGDENFDEAIERERILNDEARESYKNQFNYATKCLDELNDARTDDIIDQKERSKNGN